MGLLSNCGDHGCCNHNKVQRKVKMAYNIVICHNTKSYRIALILSVLVLALVSFVRSFVLVPVPISHQTSYRHRHRHGGSSYCLLNTRLSATSATTDYLESLYSLQHISDASLQPHLQPPQPPLCCEPMVWEDGKQISENAFCVDLPKELLKELRDYADQMGITDMYRRLLVVDGQPLLPGTEYKKDFQGYNWMVQRPKSHWASNMHWTSPADETAHDDYLRVLSAGGFDEVLEKVGAYFNLEGLSAYHLSFIGVSHCEKGFIHADVNDSGRKAFNMIIPLILQEDEGPELEILSDDETITQYYKYEYNVASMVGDNALHATASCDYQTQSSKPTTTTTSTTTKNGGETIMRMAATVYIGDITPENVNHLLMSLTQAYPPVGNAQHLLDRAGSHWSKSNPSKKLPVPI